MIGCGIRPLVGAELRIFREPNGANFGPSIEQVGCENSDAPRSKR